MALMGLMAVTGTSAAHADEVTSKGVVVHGKITGLSSDGLTFEPDFGKGAVTIKWEDVTDVKSDESFQVLYGDGLEADAPLQGFADGHLLVGAQPEGTSIDVTTIQVGDPIAATGLTWEDRMRSYWRYWSGNLDIGLNVQQATTDTTGFLIGFKTTRKNNPLRLIFAGNYRYATEKTSNICPSGATCPPTKTTSTTTTIQDQLYGLARAEYDLTARLYGFASGEGTYDSIQKISIRAVPKAGLGYTIWEEKLDEDKRNFLSGEVGPSFVYERFFGGDEKNYFAIAFGLLAGYHLPLGCHFDGLVNYLPAVDDFTSEYLLHSEAGLTMPVYDFVSAKFALVDDYSKPPAPGANSNSLFLTFGLSLVWGS
jgi:hypothetical protein